MGIKENNMHPIIQILLFIVLFILIASILLYCVRIIPQSQAYVVERLGHYYKTLLSGPRFLIPFVDRVANKVTLKEIVKEIK